MQTESLERTLRTALRETLDRELGPDPVWTGSPAARRVAELSRRGRWPLRALAVAALIGSAIGGALLAGAGSDRSPVALGPAANGWVAFTVAQQADAGSDPDVDIWFTAIRQEPRRVVGSDTDTVDQVCPAFSPDGSRLAYGSIEGIRSAGTAAAYRDSALVIADVADDGSVTARLAIDVGDGLPPACAVWSPDGERLALGVPLTSPINPGRSGLGSDVWIVRASDGQITVVPDLLATDLEWSPDGSTLAIVGGIEAASGEGVIDGLQDSRIHLYDLRTGTLNTLSDTLGATQLAWSPDGQGIAYAGRGAQPASDAAYDGRGGLRLLDVESGRQQVLVDSYRVMHGVGPVWSPDGRTIALQQSVGGERHEVVLVTPNAGSDESGPAKTVALPTERATADGRSFELWPWRVIWSPDGAYLLYVAWTFATGAEETVIVAVPIDPGAPAVVLAALDGIGAYDFADDAPRLPIQVWQGRPQ